MTTAITPAVSFSVTSEHLSPGALSKRLLASPAASSGCRGAGSARWTGFGPPARATAGQCIPAPRYTPPKSDQARL
jgi:hypothetical protein